MKRSATFARLLEGISDWVVDVMFNPLFIPTKRTGIYYRLTIQDLQVQRDRSATLLPGCLLETVLKIRRTVPVFPSSHT